MEIAGRTAIVTGGAAATGRAIVERLAAEGASVVVADIDTVAGLDVVRQIRSRGGRAEFVRADVRHGADVEDLVTTAERMFGPLDILINNAGGWGHVEPHFPDATSLQWESTIDLNLRGAMLATQLAITSMRRSGGGAVVNIASTAGLGYTPYTCPEYAAAKAGLIRFTTTLRDLGDQIGVRVNCVVPDWIATERAIEEFEQLDPDERATTLRPIPLKGVVDAVLDFVRDERLAGRVLVMRRGEAPNLIDPNRRD